MNIINVLLNSLEIHYVCKYYLLCLFRIKKKKNTIKVFNFYIQNLMRKIFNFLKNLKGKGDKIYMKIIFKHFTSKCKELKLNEDNKFRMYKYFSQCL